MASSNSVKTSLITTGEATAILPIPEGKPITVIGTPMIRDTLDEKCLQQAMNTRLSPGVTDVVVNPDAHAGYGAPVGCVLVSPTHIYPGPVGVDIKCSMSLLQLDLPKEAIEPHAVGRALIRSICQRLPTGPGTGQRSVPKGRPIGTALGRQVAMEGASDSVCSALGIPAAWSSRCEDAFHVGHNNTADALSERLDQLIGTGQFPKFAAKVEQLGSYGGGNHFGECETVEIASDDHARRAADVFGLQDGRVAFLSHCGSRGFGFQLAKGQFQHLQNKFQTWSIPLSGDDRELVYAPLGTSEANNYLDDMALGANFATVNHMLINALVLEAFQEVIPGTSGHLVYFISHNIARPEIVNGRKCWVHRKGATRAFPAGHFALKSTPFAETGHPILLPGNPSSGSVVMVADAEAEKSCFSVNHGAGRAMARRAAIRDLDQAHVDADLQAHDILTNCTQYPKDEAPAAYKDFSEVLRSVESAGLAHTVARLRARFVIKDSDSSLGGAA